MKCSADKHFKRNRNFLFKCARWSIFGRQLWDFIEAATPAPGEKPDWFTVRDYELRPRLLWQRWQDLTTLIGVRFDSETYYGLIDIDVESPHCNAAAIADIRAALDVVACKRNLKNLQTRRF